MPWLLAMVMGVFSRSLVGGEGGDLFELLGQFPRQGDRALLQYGQGLCQIGNAVRCLQHNDAAGFGAQHLHGGLAFCTAGGKKPSKHKTLVTSALRHGARNAQRGGDAAGTRQRQHTQTRCRHSGGKPCAWIADAGGPCVAHVHHALTCLQTGQDLLRGLGLVVLVHGEPLAGGFVDAVGAQQAMAVARILAGQGVGQLQYMQSAQRDVCQVADGGGHHIQGALGIMLRAGCMACSVQNGGKRGAQWVSLARTNRVR